jgi:hypothetical protein
MNLDNLCVLREVAAIRHHAEHSPTIIRASQCLKRLKRLLFGPIGRVRLDGDNFCVLGARVENFACCGYDCFGVFIDDLESEGYILIHIPHHSILRPLRAAATILHMMLTSSVTNSPAAISSTYSFIPIVFLLG